MKWNVRSSITISIEAAGGQRFFFCRGNVLTNYRLHWLPRIAASLNDHEDTLDILSVMLQDRFQVLTCKDGHQAVQQISAEEPDMILMDLRPGDVDGWKLLTDFRNAGLTAPVIAVSGDVMRDVPKRALAAGFAAFVGKPRGQCAPYHSSQRRVSVLFCVV